MYTLKVHWTRHESPSRDGIAELADEMTLFIPADRITVHGRIDGDTWQENMKHWDLDSYRNLLKVIYYDDDEVGGVQYIHGRLIKVESGHPTIDRHEWLLTSQAWLLGPNGRTIEHVAP